MPRTGVSLVLAAIAAALLAAALSACGGGDSSATAASSSADRQAARLKFTKCMRDHGVSLPDNPQPGAGGGGGGRRAAIQQAGQARFQAAAKACAKYRAQAFGNLTPQQRQAFQDAFVKFSACMRQHGVDVPTPNFNGGGPPADGQQRRRLDRSDPTVQAAMKACGDKLPRRGRGGPPGGPPPAPGGSASQ